MTFFGGIAFISVFFYAIFDNGGFYYWRSIFVIQGIVGLLDLLVDCTYAWNIDTVSHRLKNSGKEKAVKMVSRYLEHESAV